MITLKDCIDLSGLSEEQVLAIKERESAAVKAALQSLLGAPIAGSRNGRGRKARTVYGSEGR